MNSQRVLLNLGCGDMRPRGWVNTDCSLNSLAQRYRFLRPVARRIIKSASYESPNAHYMNLNRPWRFRSSTVDIVYGSHIFEHLTRAVAKRFLREAWRVLKPGGAIRLVVPDLYQLAQRYIAARNQATESASADLLYALNLHRDNIYNKQESLGARILHAAQGYPHQHKYMYDEPSLGALLRQHGFVKVRSTTYGQSDYVAEIAEVENRAEGIPAIYLEALREQTIAE